MAKCGDHKHEEMAECAKYFFDHALELVAAFEERERLLETYEPTPKCSHCGALGPHNPCGSCYDEEGNLIE